MEHYDNYYHSSFAFNYSGIFALQLLMAAIILAGDQLFAKLRIQPPAIYETIKNNKFMAGIMTYFAGKMLKSFVTSTKAFEIYINGDLVSSAINSGSIMKPETLAKQVLRYLD